jgi:uncharacterized protein
MKVAIAGGTGFVGIAVVAKLRSLGHSVVVLTRDPQAARTKFPGSDGLAFAAYSELDRALAGCDGVVNLAGEPIAENRWTPEVKQGILDSRVKTTEAIVAAINQAQPKPQVLVNASALGFYGTSETASFDETSAAGNDFLAEVCQAWETAAQQVKDTRLVTLRIGIVLGNGGALGKMLTPFRMFAGGPIGTGKQWFSWIHMEDLVNLIVAGLTDSQMQGTYNATAPNPVRMNDVCVSLGQALQRPSWLPVPAFALDLLLGDGAKVVLEGQQVLPKRLVEQGFAYQYPEIRQAIAAIV